LKNADLKGPILPVDCPDTDVIRVGEKYYMLSTSMYFFPGCEVMESDDLINWRHASYVFDSLDRTDSQRLINGNIYGAGMWAASFRYNMGTFYICFVANDTQKTYLFRSSSVNGPWVKNYIEGFYHDCSLLFDDDNRVYIAYGNRDIYITELNDNLTAPKEGGFHKLVVQDSKDSILGFEGTHFYKINGVYYLIFIHSGGDEWFRTQWCFKSDSLSGVFKGREIFADDNSYRHAGIAQGAFVDTADGKWYAFLFQDRGGSGRIPYMIPMTFEDEWPIVGDNGKLPNNYDSYDYNQAILFAGSDDFKTFYSEDSCFGFKNVWQFNHEPETGLISRNLEKGTVRISTDKVCTNVTEAKNSLTQRMCEPACDASITVCARDMKKGDIAGLSALQFLYGMIGIRVEDEGYSIIYACRQNKDSENSISVLQYTKMDTVTFKIRASFGSKKDEALFYYNLGDGFKQVPIVRDMPFMLEHFTGYRFAISVYSTIEPGGAAVFSDFIYHESDY